MAFSQSAIDRVKAAAAGYKAKTDAAAYGVDVTKQAQAATQTMAPFGSIISQQAAPKPSIASSIAQTAAPGGSLINASPAPAQVPAPVFNAIAPVAPKPILANIATPAPVQQIATPNYAPMPIQPTQANVGVTIPSPAPVTNQYLKDTASRNGWQIGYDNVADMVTITDLMNGGVLRFKNGQGQEYGMGGNLNGNNMVSDEAKLRQAIFQASQPSPMLAGMSQPGNGYNAVTEPTITPTYVAPEAPKLELAQPPTTPTGTVAGAGTVDQFKTPAESAFMSSSDRMNNAENETGIKEQAYKNKYDDQINNLLARLNTMGEFQNKYRDEVLALANQALSEKFAYVPNQDAALLEAQRQAANAVMDQMVSRNMLNSSITRDELAKSLSNLIPEYQKMAYTQYSDRINNMFKKADLLNSLDKQDYQAYIDNITSIISQADAYKSLETQAFNTYKNNLEVLYKAYDRKLNDELKAIELDDKKIQRATDKVNTLGYVDNASSIVLGLPVGTPSKAARETMDNFKAEVDLKKFNAKLEISAIDYKQSVDNKTIQDQERKAKLEKQRQDTMSKNYAILLGRLQQKTLEQQYAELTTNADAIVELIGYEKYVDIVNGVINKMQAVKDKEIEREDKNRVADREDRKVLVDETKNTETERSNKATEGIKEYENTTDRTYKQDSITNEKDKNTETKRSNKASEDIEKAKNKLYDAKDSNAKQDDFVNKVQKYIDDNFASSDEIVSKVAESEDDNGRKVDTTTTTKKVVRDPVKTAVYLKGIEKSLRDSNVPSGQIQNIMDELFARNGLNIEKKKIVEPNSSKPASRANVSRTDIDKKIEDKSGKVGIDPDFVKAVIKAESNFDPNSVSSAGAIGLMQLMPDTAKGLGVDPYNADQNLDGGIKHLKYLYEKYGGDLELVLSAYNAGEGNVSKAQKNGLKIPNFAETKAYVPKVLEYYNQYKKGR